MHPGSLEHANELGRRPVGARPMHPTLSPALVRTRAARGPVAIMISLNFLKSGAQIEWSSLGYFGGLELKTAQAATLPSSSTCPAAPAAVGYHLRRHRRCCLHLHLGSLSHMHIYLAHLACLWAMKCNIRSHNHLNTPPLCPTSSALRPCSCADGHI